MVGNLIVRSRVPLNILKNKANVQSDLRKHLLYIYCEIYFNLFILIL
jgi:hypothetical protein